MLAIHRDRRKGVRSSSPFSSPEARSEHEQTESPDASPDVPPDIPQVLGALALAALLPAASVLAQTKGGTLNMIVQPEPPVIVTAINQQGRRSSWRARSMKAC